MVFLCISKSAMAMCSRGFKTNAQLTFFVAGAVPGHWLHKHPTWCTNCARNVCDAETRPRNTLQKCVEATCLGNLSQECVEKKEHETNWPKACREVW